MSLKFDCKDCGRPIITKYLKVGEIAKCPNCGAETVVPGEAIETHEEPQYGKPTSTEPKKVMERKQSRAKGQKLDLDPPTINMVTLILILNAAISAIFYMWQSTSGLLDTGSSRTFMFIFWDLFFAYNLYRRKPWARTWIIIRSVLGGALWLGVSLYKHDILGAIWQVIFAGAIIALLSGKIRQVKARVLAIVTIGFLLYIGYSNANAILQNQNIAKRMSEIGQNSYTSNKYGYTITAPPNWRIIGRKDFKKIGTDFLESDAEIALLRDDLKGYCLIIAEELEGSGEDYDLEALRNSVLSNVKGSGSVQILENRLTSGNGDAGFEIEWSQWIEGFDYRFLTLYTVHQNTGINILSWAMASNAEEIFGQVKDISSRLKLDK